MNENDKEIIVKAIVLYMSLNIEKKNEQDNEIHLNMTNKILTHFSCVFPYLIIAHIRRVSSHPISSSLS